MVVDDVLEPVEYRLVENLVVVRVTDIKKTSRYERSAIRDIDNLIFMFKVIDGNLVLRRYGYGLVIAISHLAQMS